MNKKKHNGHILKWTVAIVLAFVFFAGCRKYDSILLDTSPKYEELKSRFFNTNSTEDVEIKKLAGDIKKQDSIFQFLPDFVKKNGIPKWDKVFYKTNRGLNLGIKESIISNSSSTAYEASNNESNNSQGILFM
jgi:phage pi2 protein 07